MSSIYKTTPVTGIYQSLSRVLSPESLKRNKYRTLALAALGTVAVFYQTGGGKSLPPIKLQTFGFGNKNPAFSIPESWVNAGVVLGQGPALNNLEDEALRKELDRVLDDSLEPRNEREKAVLGSKPHIFTVSSLKGKVIKTPRSDIVATMVKDSLVLNAKRVEESLTIRRLVERNKLIHLEVPRLVLYPRFNQTTGRTNYAVVADHVNDLVNRVTGKEVAPLTRDQLFNILSLYQETGELLDCNPENLPLQGNKIALIDVEPFLNENLEFLKSWGNLTTPWNAAAIRDLALIKNLNLLREWNTADKDSFLIDKEIRLLALKGLLKTLSVAATSMLLKSAIINTISPSERVLNVSRYISYYMLATGGMNVMAHLFNIALPNIGKTLVPKEFLEAYQVKES
ncbi:hypothetical protein AB751O23_BI_00060 [Chlamydiales bacterium SCGC AB-751-O23]|jgi:hypothetical protein|nr:hypothetical protein AB751O23_BI_00060 [Chlamydiales bacterium SCGC AB-751-O23]